MNEMIKGFGTRESPLAADVLARIRGRCRNA